MKRQGDSDASISSSEKTKRLCISQVEKLCEACQEGLQQFEKARLEALQKSAKGLPIPNFKYDTPHCPLCRILRAHLGRTGLDGLPHYSPSVILRAFSFLRSSTIVKYADTGGDGKIRHSDIPCLKAPSPKRQDVVFLVRKEDKRPRAFSPQVLGQQADLQRCEEWIQHCQRHHKDSCRQSGPPPIGLSLMHCETFEIFDKLPTTTPYVALSYVWGAPKSAKDQEYPQTIKDAAKVTKGLGYEYIWIDRYCIKQDSEDKHHQISQMDLVYQAADVTIIAAAGDDANSGLPGVSKPRAQQMVADLGDYLAIHFAEPPHVTIPKTVWSSRGWTLQEAFLSRRRLVFTSDQVYFECPAMNCCESLLEDRDLLHVVSKERAKNCLHPGIFGGGRIYSIQPKAKKSCLDSNREEALRNLTIQYTSRKLSFELDSLNAFMGILKHFQAQDPLLRHIWGLEVTKGNTLYSAQKVRIALGWRHDTYQMSFPSRRQFFPSWSWVGWSGPMVHFYITFEAEDVSLDLSDGSRLPIKQILDSSHREVSEQWSKPVAINLKATFVDASNMVYVAAFPVWRFRLNDGQTDVHLFLSVRYIFEDRDEIVQSFSNRKFRLIAIGELSGINGLVIMAAGKSYTRIGCWSSREQTVNHAAGEERAMVRII
jgi:hypothetical protein